MLHSFDRCAAEHGAETEGREKMERVADSRILAAGMPPYPRAMLRHACLLLAALTLGGCAPDSVLAMGDVGPDDAARDGAAEAAVTDAPAADAAEVAVVDAAPADVLPDAAVPDVAPVDAGQLDAAAPDASEAAVPDAAPADVPALDAAPTPDVAADRVVADAAPPPDVAVDVVTDRPDAGPPSGACPVLGQVRCFAGERWSCVGGTWMSGPCGVAVAGSASVCTMDACYVCRAGDSGTGCAADPFCSTDADCLGRGLARCVAGLCSRRAPVACASDTDCVRAWGAVPSGMQCNERLVAGGTAFRCENPAGVGVGTGVGTCTDDSTCPRGYSCYASDHFCHAP